jgi:hypothetical protein
MRPFAEDGAHERRENRSRADFDEHPRAMLVHGVDHIAESHGRGEMISQAPGDLRGESRVWGRIEV